MDGELSADGTNKPGEPGTKPTLEHTRSATIQPVTPDFKAPSYQSVPSLPQPAPPAPVETPQTNSTFSLHPIVGIPPEVANTHPIVNDQPSYSTDQNYGFKESGLESGIKSKFSLISLGLIILAMIIFFSSILFTETFSVFSFFGSEDDGLGSFYAWLGLYLVLGISALVLGILGEKDREKKSMPGLISIILSVVITMNTLLGFAYILRSQIEINKIEAESKALQEESVQRSSQNSDNFDYNTQ